MTQKHHGVTCAALAAALALWGGPTVAQVVIGESGEDAVEVNLEVLDSLAPEAGGTAGQYGDAFQGASTGSVLLIAPSGEALPEPVAAESVLVLDQPATTPEIAGADLVVPEVPGSKPAVPSTIVQTPDIVTAETDAGSMTTTTTMTTIAAPEPEPVIEETTVAATEVTVGEDAGATDVLAADTADDPFAQLDEMLAEPVAPEEIEVPEPDMSLDDAEVASLPEAAPAPDAGADLRLLFEPDSDAMTEADEAELAALAGSLAGNDNQRIQLRAYASSSDGTASTARRLALARALQVRAYLIENGIRSTRIDVRALGNKIEDDGPVDRIDVVLVEG